MKAMILAAGRGERLRPLTDTRPKALVEVQGQSLLERHLFALAAGGVTDVVINLGWLGEHIVRRVGGGSRYGLHVTYSPEYDRVLDTGGGIRRALALFGDAPFWVVNADILTDFEFDPAAVADDANASLVLVPTPAYRKSGDFDLVGGRVRNGDDPVYTFSGIARYRPTFFADQAPGRFSVVPLWRAAADRGELRGLLHTGLWADVGTPERLAALNG